MGSCLTVAQVRARVDAALQAGAFVRSRHAPELLGLDTDNLMPGSYSISTPGTVTDQQDGRDRLYDVADATTTLEIRTVSRLRADAQSQDYDAALDHEHLVLRTVLQDTDLDVLALRVNGVPRRTLSSDGAWLTSLIRIEARHRFSFA